MTGPEEIAPESGPAHGLANWASAYLARVGHLWYENPKTLVTFVPRLLGTWKYVLADLAPRKLPGTLWQVARQFFRTFFRGFFVVLAIGIAVGLGVGVVARNMGELIQPKFGSTVVFALLRDAAPLMLAVVLAARMGSSVAAKLATPDPRRPGPKRVGASDLTELVVPHIVAALLTSGIFYFILSRCVIQGYLGLGSFSEVVRVDKDWYLSLESTRHALTLGALKSVGYGVLVAYTAAALGIQAREHQVIGKGGVERIQNAVWESTVTSLLLCTGFTVLLWNLSERPGV
jgi:ABC-type transporter Mla maintaining outer membrane lipid asymmetry permease subunit MlaE